MGNAHLESEKPAVSVYRSRPKPPQRFRCRDKDVRGEQSCSSETEILYWLKVDHGGFSEIFTPLCDIRS